MLGVTRTDLQATAEEKIEDARFLLHAGRFSNAYYLAGYAVEIGLKACIARQFMANTIPDRKFVNDVHVHDLSRLVGLAGLNPELQHLKDTNLKFATHWAMVLGWTPEARYTTADLTTASSLVIAVSDPRDGILAWIRTGW